MRPLRPVLLAALALASCGGDPAGDPAGGTQAAPTLEQLVEESRVDELVALLEPRRTEGSLEPLEAVYLARARVAQGEIPKAVLVLQGAHEATPDRSGVALELARLYDDIRQHEKALATLERCRAAGGDDADLALQLGVTCGHLRRFDRARGELERARAAGADVDDVDYNLALIERAEGDHSAAAERLEAVLERHPDRLHVRRELARSRMDRGGADLEAVRADAEAALAADEHDWRAWELLGDVERARHDHQAAQAYYTRALEWGSKAMGFSPPHLEDKYRDVATRLQEELREQGLLPEDAQPARGGAPPLPESILERQREAARQARGG